MLDIFPYIVILDHTSCQYRCRLAGTAGAQGLGLEPTDRLLNQQLMGSAYMHWFRRLETVRRAAKPMSGEENLWWLDRSLRHFHWLCPPLASNGSHVDGLLLCIDWD